MANANVNAALQRNRPDAYIVFDDLQLTGSDNENMYLDQQNETVVCAANCTFSDMNRNGDAGDSDGNSAIVIGPDATTAFGQTTAILRLNQGYIDPYRKAADPTDTHYLDIRFDTPTGGNGSSPCICTVALGDGMIDLADGFLSTNAAGPASVSGPIVYGGPQVGAALSLTPNELGLGVNTDTAVAPNKFGLKLRVECGSLHDGKAKLVVLAGTSNTPVTLLDEIGSGMSACQ